MSSSRIDDAGSLRARVEAYFAAVDRKDLPATLAFLAPDAVFRIATFDTVFVGHAQIAGMFERLFERYAQIWHGDFEHLVQPPFCIATQFKVRNVHAGGTIHKNNCNFFRLDTSGERFASITVYMSGDNALA